MSERIENKVFSNLIWRFAERCGAQLVLFVVSVILARLLAPADYGTVSLLTVFTSILQVFVDSGLGNSLIQKKDADTKDFSTVFYANILFCVVLYILICSFAPMISAFYNDPNMTPMLRVLGLTVLISGLKNVQQAYVSRHMMFRKFFFSTLGGTLVAAIVGIVLAYTGFGAWALIAQQVINLFIDTVILWITVKWRPTKEFSIKRLKVLYSFGWKLLVSGLLDNIYNNLRSLIIGKQYTTAELAYYNQGNRFPHFFVNNINNAIDSVLLPVMSNEQENVKRVRSMTRRSIKTSVYIMAPLMMGMAFAAESLIQLVLTEKWLPCIFYLRIFCITYIFYPIHTANLNAIKAVGRSDILLITQILKKIIGMAALLISMWFGVKAIACSLLITTFTSQIINSWPNRKLLDYSYIDQLKDILPCILLSVSMGCCIWPVSLLGFPDLITLIIQGALGAAIYIGGSILLRLDSFHYLLEIVMSYLKKRSKR